MSSSHKQCMPLFIKEINILTTYFVFTLLLALEAGSRIKFSDKTARDPI